MWCQIAHSLQGRSSFSTLYELINVSWLFKKKNKPISKTGSDLKIQAQSEGGCEKYCF